MPIPQEDIITDVLAVAATDTVAQVQARLPANRSDRAYKYVVWAVEDGRYIVVRWVEIEDIARAQNQDISQMAIGALPGLPRPVEAVEQDSMGLQNANRLRDEQPGKRLVVLSNGTVIGLLLRQLRDADELPPDPFAAIPKAPPSFSEAEPPQPPPPRRPMVLGGDDEAEPPSAAEAPPAAPAADTRVINGWIPGVDHQTPMQVQVPYELKFNIGQSRDDALVTVGRGALGETIRRVAAGQSFVTVMVVVEPGDFTLYGVDAQEIVVPVESNAASKNTVTFTIEASKEGANSLNAILYINGNLFQRVTLTVQVGKQLPAGTSAVTTKATGMTLVSATALPARPRDQTINIVIIKKEAGYQIIAQGGGVARAFLNISTEGIADWVTNARKTLHDIVHLQDKSGNYIYQNANTTIPAAINQQSLKSLAETGALLYYNLFYNSSNEDARKMGDLLKELSRKHQLNIQIVAERFFFPWSFLFDGDDADLENPTYEHFWGFKHIIEYLPEFTLGSPVNFVPTISVGDTVDLAFVCNKAIDTQFGQPIVQGQIEAFNQIPGISVQEYPTVNDLVRLLRGPASPPLIYFYCHAISQQPGESGGTDFSRISLTDSKVTIASMKLKTMSAVERLSQAPLVFLNACESAELSPFLYDGWVPFLLSRGARGVLGTEVETPAFFAAEFAKDFITRFTKGDYPLGQLLRDMRVEYARDRNNPMGLLYALYSNGEVVIQHAG